MSAFPSHTHTIERVVKKSNYCSITKRVEITRSIYTIANSSSIQVSKNIARSLENEEKNKDFNGIVRNKNKSKAIINYVLKPSLGHQSFNDGGRETYTRNRAHISEMMTLLKEQFKTVWQQEEITTYHQHARDALPDTVASRQLPTVTDTPLIEKRVPYSAMAKKNGQEIAIRNIIRKRCGVDR